jgi:hypothetical protein
MDRKIDAGIDLIHILKFKNNKIMHVGVRVDTALLAVSSAEETKSQALEKRI